MSDAILVAIIGGLFSVVGIIITSNRTKKDILAKMEMQFTVQDEQIKGELEILKQTTTLRIDHLANEVAKHNGFATRMPVVEEQIKVANHRIADIEKKVG